MSVDPTEIAALLNGRGFIPIAVTEQAAALRAALRRHAAALVAEWSTPGLCVHALVRRIHAADATPTLIVAETSRPIHAAFDAGATDFSIKSAGELMARLRRAIAAAPPPTKRTVGRLTVDLHRRIASLRTGADDELDLALTPLERELLMALTSRLGENISVSSLLETVWSTKDVQPHALEAAISRLRARLGASRGLIVRGRSCYRLGPRLKR